jgi:hypothetical protein
LKSARALVAAPRSAERNQFNLPGVLSDRFAVIRRCESGQPGSRRRSARGKIMSIGLILLIILIIFLFGGFSGRFGGYGYGYGHGGIGVIGVIMIIVVVLLLTGRL